MKNKKAIFTLIPLIVILAQSVTAKNDSLTARPSISHHSVEIGTFTGFGLKMIATGDVGYFGMSIPSLLYSFNYQKPGMRFTSNFTIGMQMGVTGLYTSFDGEYQESYPVASMVISGGNSFNWKNQSDRQIYSGYGVGLRVTEVFTPNRYPIFYPSFGSLALQLDAIGFRGLLGKKKEFGYNVALGAGYKGILHFGVIHKL